jgi:hypothetical protein
MWNIVHILLCLLGISSKSSFHHCPMECMFNFENGSNTEAVPNVLQIFLNATNIWDNDCAMIWPI